MSWTEHFTGEESSHHGYVDQVDRVEDLIELFEEETHSHFVKGYTFGSFGKSTDQWLEDNSGSISFIRWFHLDRKCPNSDKKLDGIPFVLVGGKNLLCHQSGPKRRLQDLTHQTKAVNGESSSTGGSKKVDCKAAIKVRHVIKFPDFKLHCKLCKSRKIRTTTASKIHDALKYNAKELTLEPRFYVTLPREHHNHELKECSLPIHPRVRDLIKQNVREDKDIGLEEIQVKILDFVKFDLFADKELPSKNNTRYYPLKRTIRNHMVIERSKHASSYDIVDRDCSSLSDIVNVRDCSVSSAESTGDVGSREMWERIDRLTYKMGVCDHDDLNYISILDSVGDADQDIDEDVYKKKP